jgi:NAD-specific glutamate dehydrogenase
MNTRTWALVVDKRELEAEILRSRQAYRKAAQTKGGQQDKQRLNDYHRMLMSVYRERFLKDERLVLRDIIAMKPRTTRRK